MTEMMATAHNPEHKRPARDAGMAHDCRDRSTRRRSSSEEGFSSAEEAAVAQNRSSGASRVVAGAEDGGDGARHRVALALARLGVCYDAGTRV